MIFKFANIVFNPLNKGDRQFNTEMKTKLSYYNSGNYINYITRDSAVITYDENDTPEQMKADFENSGIENFADYLTTRMPKGTNAKEFKIFEIDWSTDKAQLKYTTPEQAKIKIGNISNNEMFADLIISPDNPSSACKEIILSQTHYSKLIEKTLTNFFESNNIDKKQVKMFFSIHGNTAHPHAHIGFKFPSTIDINKYSNAKLRYIKPFTKQSLQKAVWNANNYHSYVMNREKFKDIQKEMWDARHELRKTMYKQKIDLTQGSLDKLWKLVSEKPDVKKLKYHMLNKEDKYVVDQATKFIIDSNKDLKEAYLNYEFQKEHFQGAIQSLWSKDFQKTLLDKEQREYDNSIQNNMLKATHRAFYLVKSWNGIKDELNGYLNENDTKANQNKWRGQFKKSIINTLSNLIKIDYKILNSEYNQALNIYKSNK